MPVSGESGNEQFKKQLAIPLFLTVNRYKINKGEQYHG